MTRCNGSWISMRFVGLVSATWLALGATPAAAQLDALYFTALNSRLASLSSQGGLGTAVFLRWDVTEGPLPADVGRYRVYRDGIQIAELPNASDLPAVMDAPSIAALYVGADQERRKFELIRWLNGMDATTPGGCSIPFQAHPITNANFHLDLNARLQCDLDTGQTAFSFLASRVDFNIAQARYYGYLDTSAPAGLRNYELRAIPIGGGAEVKVGEAVTTAGATVQQIAAIADATQVTLGRCDAPESGKDHGTVALNWNHPGNQTERFANAQATAGYDLYRAPGSPIAGFDLTAQAALVAHDANGVVVIPGVSKVNDQPLAISGSPQKEGFYDGENPPFSQILETADVLSAAGLEPGDAVTYYIVARDFTANYGATFGKEFTVQDTRKPPAPWSIETVSNSATGVVAGSTGEFTLVWDHVDVPNFHTDFQSGRTYCNLDTARFDKELTYVREGASCEATAPFEVPLDIDEYLVYRFDDHVPASEFTDSDGDGISDQDEQDFATVPGRVLTGTACDSGAQPVGATNHLIATIPIPSAGSPVVRPSGRRVIEYKDISPVGPVPNKSKIFWYRVVARSGTNFSPMSAPRRGLFRDRTRPTFSQVDDVKCGRCQWDYTALVETAPNAGEPDLVDATEEGDAVFAQFICQGGSPTVDIVDDAMPGIRGAVLDPDTCGYIDSICNGQDPFVAFYDESFLFLGGANLGVDFTGCPINNVTLTSMCDAIQPLEREGSMTLAGRLRCDCPTCGFAVNLYQDVGDELHKLETVLPADWPVTLDLPDLGGNTMCFSAAIANDNNVLSSKKFLGCLHLTLLNPDPPQLADVTFAIPTQDGQLVWVPPRQPVLGTIIEWWRQGDSGREREMVAHSNSVETSPVINFDVTLAGNLAVQEEWCFRGRSVGRSQNGNGHLSVWSPPFCAIRLPVTEALPEYMRWPQIPVPGDGDALTSAYLFNDQKPMVFLTEEGFDTTSPSCRPNLPTCGDGTCTDPTLALPCIDVCSDIEAALADKLHFVAYRQETPPGGTAGEFYQVSPAIDKAYCDRDHALNIAALADPYIKYAQFVPPGVDYLFFVDRFPHISGYDYRYQFVYFDTLGEIVRSRTSNWVSVP